MLVSDLTLAQINDFVRAVYVFLDDPARPEKLEVAIPSPSAALTFTWERKLFDPDNFIEIRAVAFGLCPY